MKTDVTFSIDYELLGDFISVVKARNISPDELIEEIIKKYIAETSSPTTIKESSLPTKKNVPIVDNDYDDLDLSDNYVVFTEKLLQKCKKLKVGQLANILLRDLLERGIATSEEVEAMQKIPSWKLAKKLKLPFGEYSNHHFGLNFPLLVGLNGSPFIIAKSYKNPLKIYGKGYYLCAQWFEQDFNDDRTPLEYWILNHLPKWLESANEEQKKKFENFLKMRI